MGPHVFKLTATEIVGTIIDYRLLSSRIGRAIYIYELSLKQGVGNVR